MARRQGPEEFFEVFRKAKEKDRRTAQPARPEPEQGPADEADAETPEPTGPQRVPGPGRTDAQPESGRRYPLSVFAEDEPTVTIRRSTLVFAIIVGLVLLFIAYALGRRSARPAARPTGTITRNRDGLIETSRPALPDRYRNKWAIHLKALDRTRRANPENARAYRDFVRREADFLEEHGKEAFIISHGRELFVCVGPFEDARGNPELHRMVDKLRGLRYNGGRLFASASVRRLPRRAKLFE
ncbi:MAG: hypothetical protein R6V58_17975 [Planctomycetota bacterium]